MIKIASKIFWVLSQNQIYDYLGCVQKSVRQLVEMQLTDGVYRKPSGN